MSSSPRHLVADHLRERLAATGAEDVTVLAHRPSSMSNITQATIIVAWDTVTPGRLPGTWLDAELTVYATTGRQQPGAADDDIDALLADVLWALEGPDDRIRWGQARRVVLDDQSWPGWAITLTVTITQPQE